MPTEDDAPSLAQLLWALQFNRSEIEQIEGAVALWLRSWVGGVSGAPDAVLEMLADDLEEGHE